MMAGRLPLSRLFGFGAVGLSVFLGGEALLFGLVHYLGLDPHIGYLVVAIVSIETSFVLNRSVNWRDRPGSLSSHLLAFHVTKAATLPINQILFAALLAAHFHYMLAMVVCTALITVVNYISNDRLVFSQKQTLVSGLAISGGTMPLVGSRPATVGIVVPVRNSGRTILRCVRALLKQDYPHFHIYVVGNASGEDSTWDALREVCMDPRVTCVHWNRPEGWHGRDGNAKRALGASTAIEQGADIVAFTDSQVEAPSNWLKTAVDLLNEHAAGGLAGVSRRNTGDKSFRGLYQDCSIFSEWPIYGEGAWLDRSNVGKAPQLPVTANLVLRADVLRGVRSTWPLHCPHGWEDFNLDWALLKSGASFLCTNKLRVYRLHKPKFRLAKNVTAGMAAADFHRSFPDSGFVQRRIMQAGLVAFAGIAVFSLLVAAAILRSPNILFGTCAVFFLTLMLFGVHSVQQSRDLRALGFPFLDAVHLLLWITGLGIALLGIRPIENGVSRFLLARR